MKKHFVLLAIILGLSASMAFSMNSDPIPESENTAISDETENTLSEEEITALTTRIEEIRDMDKSNLTPEERLELKKELKEYKKEMKKNRPIVYVGGITLLLIIIIVILLV
jgi:hypothetical protein